MEVRVGPAAVTIHSDTEFAVSEINGEMSSTSEQGYFASEYSVGVGLSAEALPTAGRSSPTLQRWRPIGLVSSSPTLSCWVPTESRSRRGRLHLRLDRTIGHGIHEDYDLPTSVVFL